MPIYEYQCKKHGRFEVSQRITEPALKSCPRCHAAVHRLISNTSFTLKGGGWYASGYSSKAPSKSAPEKRASSAKPA